MGIIENLCIREYQLQEERIILEHKNFVAFVIHSSTFNNKINQTYQGKETERKFEYCFIEKGNWI